MKTINTIAFILVIVGGLNWGLVGLFDFNLVHAILGSISALERVVYVLVGLSAILSAVSYMNMKGGSNNGSM